MSHILVTGGGGFIGSNLCVAALARGHSVSVIDDFSQGRECNLTGLDVDVVQGSILDEGRLRRAAKGADSIVHLAALGSVPRSIANPYATHEANATGTLAVLQGARKFDVDHVVVASSSSVYGMNPALPKGEREWVRPLSPYAVSKLATEQYALAYQQSFDLKTLAFRFFNVFGPRQRPDQTYAAVIPIFLDALLSGRPLPLHGSGRQSRDFTFVGTVCEVLLDAAERRVTHPEPVNLAYGTNTDLLTIIAMLTEITGVIAETESLSARPGDVQHSQAANASLRALFPTVRPTDLRKGLEETVAWFRSDLR